MVLMFRSAQRVKRPSQLRDMAARGAWALRNLEERVSLGQTLRGAAAFLLVCAFTPALILSYIALSVGRILWCKLLEWRFPGIEPDLSPSVRAATDTRRNQGVITVLLHVKGRCDVEIIKKKFKEEVVDRHNARGELHFPRLRAALTSRWGHYAWRLCTEDEFRLDSHIVVGTQFFRGRAVTDANIQDYVSDIVSKCLPADLPPWQLMLVPLAAPSAEPSFYALLRLHHLLVAELAALRTVLAGDWGWGAPIIPPPYALSYLFNSTLGVARSFWLKLRHKKDVALNPKALHQPSLDVLFIALVFLFVDASSTTLQGKQIFTRNLPRDWKDAIRVEAKKRHLTMKKIWNMLRTSLTPPRLLGCCWRVFKEMGIITIQFPLVLLHFSRSAPARAIAVQATHEVVYWSRVALDGPRHVLSELLRSSNTSLPPLLSLCGRRVVAWSEPTPVDLVERIAQAAGATPVEVLLAAASGALREHYRRQGCTTPTVPVQPLGATGVLLLPPHAPQDGILENLRDISIRIAASRHQPSLLLASAWLRKHLARVLPSLTVRLVLNCVTRRYAATIMTAAPAVLRHGPTTLWGYTIDNVLLWRPPQANISVSLSLVRIGSSVRLAVMADQQLWPHHAALPVTFVAHLRELATALHVPRTPRHSPPPGTSTSQHEMLRLEEESLVD